jgi:glycosyltransferase involved in cell wall biosynthesis
VPIVIACGRLSHQKNYPLLLKSIAQVLKKINVRLVILGDGKERKLLETFAITLGISQNVLFWEL